MNNMEFKRLEETDAKDMKEIIENDNQIFNIEYIKSFIKDTNNYGFIGKIDNKVVAFLYGYGLLRLDGKSMFYIHSVDVVPEYQNKGIGTKLMDYVLKYIIDEKKYYKFWVLTEDDNIRACKVYQKYANKEGQVMFSKNLDEM